MIMGDIDIVDGYHDKGNFMEIVDADLFNAIYNSNGNEGSGNINHALPLRIIYSTGVSVNKDFKVAVTDLNTDKNNLKYKQFTNTGDGGITFKVDVIIKKGQTWSYGVETGEDYIRKGATYPKLMKVTEWLDYWYTNMRPVYVVSDAIDVPNGIYLITDNPTRKQAYPNYTIWTLEFASFSPLELSAWKVSQSIIDATTPKKTTSSSSSTASSSSTNLKLKDCSGKLQYTSTRKTTECSKVLQQKLYELGFLPKDEIDGWYGPVTMEAVKKFQRYHNSRGGNLLVDGVAGPVTVGVMCKY